MNRIASVAVAAMLIAACTPNKPNPYPRIGVPILHGEPDIADVQITLERTTCYGSCPAYTLELDGTGKVTYKGESYVRTKGERTANVDRGAMLALLDTCEAMDFMQFGHECDSSITDMPRPTVKLRVGSHEHAFTELTGGTHFPDPDAHSQAHRAAVELMAAIDEACRVEQWIGSQQERWQNRAAYR